ncbi:acyltransferase family protein [Bradyrhizobium canariense]|nr:acyltransferase [Bradyrhizobium canariense]
MKSTTTNKTTSPQMEETKMHFRVLDSWRGVAALLVAIFHLNVLSAVYSLDFVRNAYLFVDFFFVLSGFVITHSYADRLGTLGGLGTFAIRRLGRLWPLHVVVLLAFVIVEGAKAVSAARGASFYYPPFTGATSLHSILTNLAFAQSFGVEQQLTWNPPSWSICAEFWTYLIFAAAFFIAATWLRRIRFATEAFIVAILIGSASILISFARHGIDATYDLGLARCIYGFLVGHLTYRLWRAASHIKFSTGLLEVGALIAVTGYVSVAGRTEYSFLAPLVFAFVVFVFAFESGPVSRLMLNKGNAWLGRISYSIYMWQAFIIFNFVDRPISMLEKMTGHVFATTEGASSALGGEAGKLIVLGGHVVPILVTILFVGFLIAVASVSYYLIEKPGQELFAGLARWLRDRFAQDGGRSLNSAPSVGAAR